MLPPEFPAKDFTSVKAAASATEDSRHIILGRPLDDLLLDFSPERENAVGLITSKMNPFTFSPLDILLPFSQISSTPKALLLAKQSLLCALGIS